MKTPDPGADTKPTPPQSVEVAGLKGFVLVGDRQLAELQAAVNELKPKKWMVLLQTLAVAVTVPVTAGVFSVYAQQRERELKIYEQNLALIDRAIDFDKDVRYRRAIVSYMRELDKQRPQDSSINEWLARNEEDLTTQEAELKKALADRKKVFIEEGARFEALSQKIGGSVSTASDGPLTELVINDLARNLVDLEQVSRLTARTSTEIVGLEQSLGAVADAANFPAPVPAAARGATWGEAWLVQVATDRQLEGARFEAKKVSATGRDARILFVNNLYITTAGPYVERTDAVAASARLSEQLKRGVLVRRADDLCPSYVSLAGTSDTVLICQGREGEPLQAVRRPDP
jgi:hypothetical protein